MWIGILYLIVNTFIYCILIQVKFFSDIIEHTQVHFVKSKANRLLVIRNRNDFNFSKQLLPLILAIFISLKPVLQIF